MGYYKKLITEAMSEKDRSFRGGICKNCGEEFTEKVTITQNWDGTHDRDIDVIKDCKCGKRECY